MVKLCCAGCWVASSDCGDHWMICSLPSWWFYTVRWRGPRPIATLGNDTIEGTIETGPRWMSFCPVIDHSGHSGMFWKELKFPALFQGSNWINRSGFYFFIHLLKGSIWKGKAHFERQWKSSFHGFKFIKIKQLLLHFAVRSRHRHRLCLTQYSDIYSTRYIYIFLSPSVFLLRSTATQIYILLSCLYA